MRMRQKNYYVIMMHSKEHEYELNMAVDGFRKCFERCSYMANDLCIRKIRSRGNVYHIIICKDRLWRNCDVSARFSHECMLVNLRRDEFVKYENVYCDYSAYELYEKIHSTAMLMN